MAGARSPEVIVVGLGAMGSAALCELSRRGVATLGLERHFIGHPYGSSHGRTRVIRKAYAEEPRYVPLVLRAYELWRELEEQTRPGLLAITGGLHIGPPEHPSLVRIAQAIGDHNLESETLAAAEIRERYPVLHPAPGDVAVFEPDAGAVAVEEAVAAQVEVGVRHGADVRLGVSVCSIEDDGDAVVVKTAGGESHRAARAVICSGGHLAEANPIDVRVALEVSRQVQTWFMPREPARFAAGALPLFIHHAPLGEFYAVPSIDGGPVKICRHYGGQASALAALDREVHASDIDEVREYLRSHLPEADGAQAGASVCFYTNSPDRHFVIGRAPGYRNVIVAGGFSGHGFKFAPTVGEILADLAVSGETKHSIEFLSPVRFT